MSNQAFNLIREGGVPAQGGEGSTTTPVDAAFRFVKQGTDGDYVRCSVAGEIAHGVSQYELIDGKGATLAVVGDVALVEAGDAIAYNDPVTTDAQGRAVKATTGQMVLGRAITYCAGASAHVTVILTTPALHAPIIQASIGAEGAVTANEIEVALTVKDHFGNALASPEILVESFAATADAGNITEADTPVGTLVIANNPATGLNAAYFTGTAGGLVSFAIQNANAEKTFVRVSVGGAVASFTLTFA